MESGITQPGFVKHTFMTYKDYIYKLRGDQVYAVRRDSANPYDYITSSYDTGYLDKNDTHGDCVLMILNGKIERISSGYFNTLVEYFRQGRRGYSYRTLDFGIVEITHEPDIKGLNVIGNYKIKDLEKYMAEKSARENDSQAVEHKEGNHMPKMVTHEFTLDNENVYTVNDGKITREQITASLTEYADTASNVGYLDPSMQQALMIRKNDIVRISHDAYVELRNNCERSRGQLDGLIKITYDSEVFTSKILGVSTDYKLAYRPGGDFDNIELNSEDNVPPLIQDLARTFLGRKVNAAEVTLYKIIVPAIENEESFKLSSLTKEQRIALGRLSGEEAIMAVINKETDEVKATSLNDAKMHFMRRAIEFWDANNMDSTLNTVTPSSSRQEVSSVGGVPTAAQEYAMQMVERAVTLAEVKFYARIVDAIDNHDGVIKSENSKEEMEVSKLLVKEGYIDFHNIGTTEKVSIANRSVLSYMKKMVEMCANADVKPNGSDARVDAVDWNGIPVMVQELASSTLGRNITTDEIEVYRRIIISVNNDGKFSIQAWDDKKIALFDKLFAENIVVRNKFDDSTYLIAVPDTGKLSYMKKVVELYDAAHAATGASANPLAVATAAMNLSEEERERLGLVNASVPRQQNVGTGSSFSSSGTVSIGSLHRPRSLGSTATFPFEAPCVVRKTAPYYTMQALKKPFIEFTKPVESFLTANITIDKRIPMRVVPMVTNDKRGYAFPKKVNADDKLVTEKCIPVATRVPGIYWMFYEMARSEEITTHEIQFICSALIEYIDSNSTLFDLSKSDVAASVVSSIWTAVDNIGYDTSDKQRVIEIYRRFFEETGKGCLRPMKISYKSGFVIAMTRNATQVLITSIVINSNSIDYSKYPEHITVIPLEDKYGLLVVGAEPSDIAEIERVMSGAEKIEDEGDFDQPDD